MQPFWSQSLTALCWSNKKYSFNLLYFVYQRKIKSSSPVFQLFIHFNTIFKCTHVCLLFCVSFFSVIHNFVRRLQINYLPFFRLLILSPLVRNILTVMVYIFGVLKAWTMQTAFSGMADKYAQSLCEIHSLAKLTLADLLQCSKQQFIYRTNL